jgi:hypothetical protein
MLKQLRTLHVFGMVVTLVSSFAECLSPRF